ncbi:MAG: hypothetical protein GHCLOJNM_02574 [bacterium]|nr:hypothetical protein [bacterium]
MLQFRLSLSVCLLLLVSRVAFAGPTYLDDQFTLPEGFHIYRYVEPSHVKISYSAAFDRIGRLYVGDGDRIVRVSDTDSDGVADSFESIAEGFKDRGPQGLLFLGDRIFANGDKSNWILEDLDADGIPRTRRKIGGPVETGGDHHAHAFIRGLDGYVYWLAGNDSGFTPEGHITEENSPIRKPLGSTVFRISPDGARWEAIGTGCRNPYDIAVNDLGEIFTVDSDHEGQIGLPFYRPVRVTHYTAGSRMGWTSWGDGKLMPCLIDNLPGLFTVGRASPTGVLFYEHKQFPEPYRGALFMGDYLNKRGETLRYATTGRILAFRLNRQGSTWSVDQELFAVPKKEAGVGPSFAVIDLAVAPDGSLLVTTSGDGVFRIFHDPEGKGPKPLNLVAGLSEGLSPVEEILAYPQPGETWALPRLEQLAQEVNPASLVLDASRPTKDRLRLFQLVAPKFAELPSDFLSTLSRDQAPEMRAQAAWLVGLRARLEEQPLLIPLLRDPDGLVRRRAAEALARLPEDQPVEPILPLLMEEDRWVRFAGMHALSHRDPNKWVKTLLTKRPPRMVAAALVALSWTAEGENPSAETKAAAARSLDWLWLSVQRGVDRERALENLRVTRIWKPLLDDGALAGICEKVQPVLAHSDLDVLTEATHLVGALRCSEAVPILARRFQEIEDPVLQLLIMDQLASIKDGWTPALEADAITWLDASDEGWHGDRRGKGTSYPDWWNRIVTTFIDNHAQPVLARLAEFNLTGPFGAAALAKAEKGGAPSSVDLEGLKKVREERLDNRRRELPPSEGIQHSNAEIREFVLSKAVDGGSVELGKEIFQYQCMTCHDPKSAQSRRGPNLDAIRAATPELLIDSILEPNRSVKPEFRNHLVTLADGEVVTGLPIEESETEVVYAGEGEPRRLSREEIERVDISQFSPMPENLLNVLSWNEIRDLWAYLRGGEKQGK